MDSAVESDEFSPEYQQFQIEAQHMLQKTWLHYVGKVLYAPCWCCRRVVIDALEFECAHVIPESQGGRENVPNLRPICTSCKTAMGDMNMMEFIEKCGYHTPERNYRLSSERYQEPPYTCPRCGYETRQKSHMYRHFWETARKCSNTVLDIELTEEVKNKILDDRVFYKPPSEKRHPLDVRI
jgi:predicted RNA-binding Zn-ribbon protein involved in translation (DUF1610 family)